MIIKEVVSSTISQIQYNEETSEMIIQFKNGGSYSYEGVPQNLFESFHSAESVGSFFHKNIRGEYNSTRILV
jgi:hypothetical protein